MNNIVTYLSAEYHFVNEARWLKRLLAGYSLYKCFYWILDFSLLFSADSIVYHNGVHLGWWRNFIFFLFNNPAPGNAIFFIIITAFSALYILSGKQFHRIAFFILWLAISNINNNVFCTMSGGDVLFQHLLFFCIFLGNDLKKKSPAVNELDTMFHNIGVSALQIQVCLVYFLAGYAKLADPDWMNGSAVSSVFAVHDFSLSFLYENKTDLAPVLNYSVMVYQLLFPLLVWIRKIKKWYLFLGVIQHLFIAFIIGLPSFGFIMIIAYSVFYVPFSKSRKVL